MNVNLRLKPPLERGFSLISMPFPGDKRAFPVPPFLS